MKLPSGKKKVLHVTMLGHPGSGKTTFLALLAQEAQEVEPHQADQFLQNLLSELRKGQPIPGTRPSASSDSSSESEAEEYTFHFHDLELDDTPECSFLVRDFAGECTSQLVEKLEQGRKPENPQTTELDESLSKSHATIVFADLHSIAVHGSWESWFEEKLKPIFEHISQVLSQTKKHPVLLMLTRSDLVEPSFASQVEQQAQQTLARFAIASRVVPFRAFRARKQAPPADKEPLGADYLVPHDPELETSPPIRDIIHQIVSLHQRTSKGTALFQWIGALAAFLLLGIVGLILWQQREVPVRPADVQRVFHRMAQVKNFQDEQEAQRAAASVHPRVYLPPTEGEPRNFSPWIRMARHWFKQFPPEKHPETELAERSYVRRIQRELESLYPKLNYDPRGRKWTPAEVERLAALLESEWKKHQGQDAEVKTRNHRQALLDVQWKRQPKLSPEALVAFASEYERWKIPIPQSLSERLGRAVYQRCVDTCAELLRKHASTKEYKALYEQELPDAIRKELQLKRYLPDSVAKSLEEALDYLSHLKGLKEIELCFKGLSIKKPSKSDDASHELSIRIGCILPEKEGNAPSRRYIYIPHKTLGNKEKNRARVIYSTEFKNFEDVTGSFPQVNGNLILEQGVTFKITWSYGAKLSIYCYDFNNFNESMVSWTSENIGSLERNDEDLPGLSFLVFRASHFYWTSGLSGWRSFQFRFLLDLERGNARLLILPELLNDANRRRKHL